MTATGNNLTKNSYQHVIIRVLKIQLSSRDHTNTMEWDAGLEELNLSTLKALEIIFRQAFGPS